MLFSGLTWLSHSLCRPEYLLLLQTFVSKPHIGISDQHLVSPQCRCHHNQGNYQPSSMFELGLEMAEAEGANPSGLVASFASRRWADKRESGCHILGETILGLRKALACQSGSHVLSKFAPPNSGLETSRAEGVWGQSPRVS